MSPELPKFEIKPLGEDCAIIDLGNEIDEAINDRAIAIAQAIEESPFEGFIECAPAYSSVAVYYDPCRLGGFGFSAVRSQIDIVVRSSSVFEPGEGRHHTIPVLFGNEHGPDLEEAAERNGLDTKEFIDTFVSTTYRVYILGFLPGFPYMGKVDDQIATPRRGNPRTRVAAGSVGIAGSQTGIYPFDSPGGWQIIGRTSYKVFDVSSKDPSRFKPGDTVRFSPDDLM
ncbi:MAG: allophanate hydrolase subunit 1 [Acidobacteria bacterium]|nr:MAG: allophanate hydrolase subunit 1 [Acidobacteriota bacterium]REK01636.1 MAG: allophanate hydrolase subunit 1 [Acidobacteriota bacterium]REK14592.1 MAG: allophanate hydrolase subunit 1 [Acidobacteriota bacterium]REK45307.1 MAG: allophanate hydrolase subunit 1 [Acidobacteriota bacterium]